MITLDEAYQHCDQCVRNHYENFPVAARFLPERLRKPITAIYAFARTADDLADEGNLDNDLRLKALENYEADFRNAIETRTSDNLIFIALTDAIDRYKLDTRELFKLLEAFKQDTTINRYQTFADILYYCKRSANPVGRLLLQLFGEASAQNIRLSDNICTSLQLINFYQDIEQDLLENNRIYIPEDEMHQLHISEESIRSGSKNAQIQTLLDQQYRRAYQMMYAGKKLGDNLTGLAGLQIRMVINGGLRILHNLYNQLHIPFARPRLGKLDWLIVTFYALTHRTISIKAYDA